MITVAIKTERITVYGTDWCGDCRRAKLFFSEHRIPYEWVNVDKDRDASDLITRLNNGYRSVPTIVFEDGSILVEPRTSELAQKLGILFQT